MCWSSLAASLGEQLRARGGSGYLSVVSSRVACDALLCKRVCMDSAAELVLSGKAAEMLQLCCSAFSSGERLWVDAVLCSQLQYLRGPQHQDCAVFI